MGRTLAPAPAEAPLQISLPRVRRRPVRRVAEGADAWPPAGIHGGSPAYGPEPATPGILSESEEQAQSEEELLSVPAAGKRRGRKARGKKTRKRKRRDAELEATAQISDAPPHVREPATR